MAGEQAWYTVEEILQQFDEGERKNHFTVLDGGKEIPADVRLTAYRDTERWAVVMEQLVFFPPSPGHWGIVDRLYVFGNCILGKQGSEDLIKVTGDGPDAPVFLPPIGLDVNPDARSIRIRDKVMALDLSPEALARKGIPLPEAGPYRYMRDGVLHTGSRPARLGGKHVVWSLLPEHRELLLATEQEKRGRVPADLPKFIQLEEWDHPRLIEEGIRPSDSETFRLLAEAIVAGDAGRYRPTLPPNTHWRNWLECERV